MQICLSPIIVSRSVESLTFMALSKHKLKTTPTERHVKKRQQQFKICDLSIIK